MTPLGERLIRRIAATGPISLAEYMSECLLHPEFGYYTTRDPFGTAGDFITAPEISQMFGELVGLALGDAWMAQGRPQNALLVELGPGRGTLMRDALRALKTVSGDALNPWLVEASPTLRKVQSETIGQPVAWADTLDALPDGPVFLIANEFFDALPIRQYLRDGDGWRERVVGVADGGLSFGLTDPAHYPPLDARLENTAQGDLVETCAPADALVAGIAIRIAEQGGAALIVDYGHWGGTGDTFQAVTRHRKCDPLAAPGQADLTAHVDFAALARTAAQSGVQVAPMTDQGVFLERLGITARAQQLAAGLGEDDLEMLIRAHRRLTHPEEMGSLFKVLGLVPMGASEIAGTG